VIDECDNTGLVLGNVVGDAACFSGDVGLNVEFCVDAGRYVETSKGVDSVWRLEGLSCLGGGGGPMSERSLLFPRSTDRL
jgi:hypothetical protein